MLSLIAGTDGGLDREGVATSQCAVVFPATRTRRRGRRRGGLLVDPGGRPHSSRVVGAATTHVCAECAVAEFTLQFGARKAAAVEADRALPSAAHAVDAASHTAAVLETNRQERQAPITVLLCARAMAAVAAHDAEENKHP